MGRIRPKKNLGQHFLKDKGIASRVASSLTGTGCTSVLEIGPGRGILTEYLLERNFDDFRIIALFSQLGEANTLDGRGRDIDVQG